MNSTSVMDNKALEIIQEATQLFQRYGIKSISMEELSRQLGISKRLYINTLRTKQPWLTRWLSRLLKEKLRFSEAHQRGSECP